MDSVVPVPNQQTRHERGQVLVDQEPHAGRVSGNSRSRTASAAKRSDSTTSSGFEVGELGHDIGSRYPVGDHGHNSCPRDAKTSDAGAPPHDRRVNRDQSAGVFSTIEVDHYWEVFAEVAPQARKGNGALYSALAGPLERFTDDLDDGAKEQFRGDLDGYLRAYSFLSQIVRRRGVGGRRRLLLRLLAAGPGRRHPH